MNRYDYEMELRDDVRNAIEENNTPEEIVENLATDRDAWEGDLYDDLFVDDSVTGNASGSYTFNAWKAEENIAHCLDLLEEAADEFGDDLGDLIKRGAEICDVTIRCYLLSGALSEVLDELEEEHADEIERIQNGDKDDEDDDSDETD